VPDSRGIDYHVVVTHDDEAEVWLATSPDVIGLTLEYDSLDRLQNQLPAIVAELLELNGQPPARRVTVSMTRQITCA